MAGAPWTWSALASDFGTRPGDAGLFVLRSVQKRPACILAQDFSHPLPLHSRECRDVAAAGTIPGLLRLIRRPSRPALISREPACSWKTRRARTRYASDSILHGAEAS